MELNAQLLEKLKPLGQEVNYHMGEIIIKDGDKVDKVYIILKGHASILKMNQSGEEVFIGLASVGSVLGEMGIFLEGERTATVRASSNVTALVMDAEAFLKAVSSIPELAYIALKEMSKRVNNLNRRVINISTSKLMYVLGIYLLENLKMEENPYYTPEEGKVEFYLKKFATEFSMEAKKIESVLSTFDKNGVLRIEEVRNERDGDDKVYLLSINPSKFRSYLRSIAYV